MALVSNAWLSIKRHLPIVGDDASFQYHTLQGMMRKRTLNEAFDFLNDTLPQGATAEQKATASTATQASNAQQPINKVEQYLNSRGIGKQSRLSPEDLKLEQDSIWKTTFGDQSVTQIRTRDLNDVINYSVGNQNEGAKHIIKRHIGENKYGKITEEELLDMGEIIRNGKIPRNSIKRNSDGTKSYAYELHNDGIRFRVVVHRDKEGKKIVSMYSDRKAVDEARPQAHFNSSPTVDTIIPQNTENTAKTNINQPKKGVFQSIWDLFSPKTSQQAREETAINLAKQVLEPQEIEQLLKESKLPKWALSSPAFIELFRQIKQNNNNQ
ncbi:MAG: hypothetical protein LBG67_01820 [Campylobacteraceae bacterium]|jgi:hypothetical protein|nr:hypothetical protein [Campylobacteraceae bacterium]